MKNLALLTAISIVVLTLAVSGCVDKSESTGGVDWTVEKVKVIEGFDLPECVVKNPADGRLYVSNIVTATEAYWVDDANGFITRLAPDGTIEELKWAVSTADMPINDPKGMAVFKNRLFFNDNDMLKSCPLDNPSGLIGVKLPGAVNLNDLATDDQAMWITDTATGTVRRMDAADGAVTSVRGPESINGITSCKGKVFAVSWDLHDVYELDPTGKAPAQPFGLASHFTALDGIEVLDDGTFIVSDYQGNKLCAISPDRKTVTTLIELQSPAEFLLDRQNMMIYVPEMLENRVTVLKLSK